MKRCNLISTLRKICQGYTAGYLLQ